MVPVRRFAGRRVAVLGLGATGLAASRALRAGGAKLVGWDADERRRAAALRQGFTVEDLTTRDWSGLAALIVEQASLIEAEEPTRLVALARAVDAAVIPARSLLAEAAAGDGEAGVILVSGLWAEAAADLAVTLCRGGGLRAQRLDDPEPGRALRIAAMDPAEIEALPEGVAPAALALLAPEGDERDACLRLAERARCLLASTDRRKAAALASRLGRERACLISGTRIVAGGVHAMGGRLVDAREGAVLEVADLPPYAPREAIAAGWGIARAMGASAQACLASFTGWRGAPGHGAVAGRIGAMVLADWSAAREPGRAVSVAADSHWIAGPALDRSVASVLADAPRPPRSVHLVGDRGGVARRIARVVPVDVARTLEDSLARALHAAIRDGSPLVYAPGSVFGETGDQLAAAFTRLAARIHAGDRP